MLSLVITESNSFLLVRSSFLLCLEELNFAAVKRFALIEIKVFVAVSKLCITFGEVFSFTPVME